MAASRQTSCSFSFRNVATRYIRRRSGSAMFRGASSVRCWCRRRCERGREDPLRSIGRKRFEFLFFIFRSCTDLFSIYFHDCFLKVRAERLLEGEREVGRFELDDQTATNVSQ